MYQQAPYYYTGPGAAASSQTPYGVRPYGDAQYGYQPQAAQQPVQYSQAPQTQMPQQPMLRSLPGCIVEVEDDMRRCDVPKDGIAVFPMANESCIYVRTWNLDGTIATKRYVPAVEDAVESTDASQSLMDVLNQRFDKLEAMLPQQNAKTTRTTAKGGANG